MIRKFMKGDTVEFSVSYDGHRYVFRPSRFFAMRNNGLTVTESLLERVRDVRSVRMVLLEKNNQAMMRKNRKKTPIL